MTTSNCSSDFEDARNAYVNINRYEDDSTEIQFTFGESQFSLTNDIDIEIEDVVTIFINDTALYDKRFIFTFGKEKKCLVILSRIADCDEHVLSVETFVNNKRFLYSDKVISEELMDKLYYKAKEIRDGIENKFKLERKMIGIRGYEITFTKEQLDEYYDELITKS